MGKILMEITMSLDGYTTGPEVSAEAPFGRGGDRLHEWMFAGESAADSDRRETDHFSTIGAVIIGRRMADLGIGPWGEEPTFHAPCFVVTHRPAETIVKKGGTSYIFVTEGIEAAMAQARAAASATPFATVPTPAVTPPLILAFYAGSMAAERRFSSWGALLVLWAALWLVLVGFGSG